MMFTMLAAVAVSAGIRIVSLAPALTEDLFAIGAGSQVVGADAYSNRPAAARAIPRVGGMRDVNAEAVLALRPDIVVGIPYEAAHLADITRGGARTEALKLDTLQDDLNAIARLGTLTQHVPEAQRVVGSIRARLATLADGAKRRHRRRAFVLLGDMGSAGGGSYIDELLRLANLENVAGRIKQPWLTFSAEELVRSQPDVIIMTDTNHALTGEPWDRLHAVQAGRILRVDEDDLLRPGPRVAEVLEAIVNGVAMWR